MPKNKPNKSLLKRIRFTKSGKIKFTRAFGRHRRSHKPGKLLQSYRRPAFAKGCDAKRLRAMLHMSVGSGKTRRATDSEAQKD
ncbi:MAG: 50S ribosomal protein L35 [Planctomycetes bacterium]|nr:50S ribosomal protein L35 [Planctomycetota bacterium]